MTRYIWTHTRRQQMWILLVVALSMIPYFMSFDLPKRIVNGPIQGDGFSAPGATQPFLRIAFDLPGGELVLFPGFELERLGTLFALSAVFLALVIVNGLFKYYINTYKGRLGERLLRRIRYSLVDQVLRFPPAAFKRLKPAEVASMVKDEVEPLGGFTGDAFVAPALLGGQALTALVFIFVQNVMLGCITAALVGVQFFIIPRMRRRLLVLGRERQLTARQLAGRVSEIVEGINAIHTHDTSNWERADIAHRLGRIFRIRYDIYQWKFMVKFINNFLASVTPFLFYSVGGYLALRGQLDIGQLVAVIGAYKDLPGPLKELIDWDQNRQDVQVKYQQVVSQFAVEGVLDPALQAASAEPSAGRLPLPLATVNLGVVDDGGAPTLAGVSLALRPGEAVAVVGAAGAGGDVLAEALVRVVWPSSGRVQAGDVDLRSLPEAVSGRQITYAGPDPFFFFGTVRENLLYGLRHAPLSPPARDEAGRARRAWEEREARAAGNPDFDVEGDWIDYAGFGAAGPEGLMQAVTAVLETVGLSRDILDFALRSTIDPAARPALAARIVALRQGLRRALAQQDLTDLIAPFEPEAYNPEASILDNMLFGQARDGRLSASAILGEPHVRALLDRDGLGDLLAAAGHEIARNAVELLGELPADHPMFQSQTLMTADDLPEVRLLVARADAAQGAPGAEDRARLIRLAFGYIEPRFRFGIVTPALAARVLGFRTAFRDGLPADLAPSIEFYDPARYIAAAGLLDNMLFGRVTQKYRDGAERIYATVADLLQREGLHGEMLAIGLDFHAGAGGKRLTLAQRQKLDMARALLRRSDYYVFNRPLSALDGRSQDRLIALVLDRIRSVTPEAGIVWVLAAPAQAMQFDRVAVFARGALADDGPPAALAEKNGILKEMLSA
jgi:putative ABC transport system ATP-binding protein